jgi:hypothetical protein
LKKDLQRATRKLNMELHRTKSLRELVEDNKKLYYQERKNVSAFLQVHNFFRPHMLCLIMLISSLCLTSLHQAKKEANTNHKKEINIMTQTMCAREEHVEEMQSAYAKLEKKYTRLQGEFEAAMAEVEILEMKLESDDDVDNDKLSIRE